MPPAAYSKIRRIQSPVEADDSRSGGSELAHGIVAVLADLFLGWDFAAVMLAGYLAYLICQAAAGHLGFAQLPWSTLRPDVIMASVAAPFILRGSRSAWTGAQAGAGVVGRAMGRVAILLGLIWSVEITSRISGDLPVAWLAGWSALVVMLTVETRALTVGLLRRLARKGVLVQSVAVVGAGPSADRLIRYLRTSQGPAVRVVGLFDERTERVPTGSVVPQGNVDDLVKMAQTQRLDWVVITLPWNADARVVQILGKLKSLAVEVALCPPLFDAALPGREMGARDASGRDQSAREGDLFDELPLGLLARRPLRSWSLVVKELEDKLLAALLVVLLLPVFAMLALAVRLDSPGPILFRQSRVGLNNRPFDILKFRSMRWDPDAGDDIEQTRREDRRITPLGQYLRKTSLDELPQLFNVLRGEMSLVGPRPHAVTMRTQDMLCDEIVEDYKHRHRMKPGITGWAQVNGHRGATDTPEQLRQRVEHDLYYIDNWSFRLDLRILLLTPLKILIGENAF
jgi:Undecaprenyl-phosphate glucose phosphotransferase